MQRLASMCARTRSDNRLGRGRACGGEARFTVERRFETCSSSARAWLASSCGTDGHFFACRFLERSGCEFGRPLGAWRPISDQNQPRFFQVMFNWSTKSAAIVFRAGPCSIEIRAGTHRCKFSRAAAPVCLWVLRRTGAFARGAQIATELRLLRTVLPSTPRGTVGNVVAREFVVANGSTDPRRVAALRCHASDSACGSAARRAAGRAARYSWNQLTQHESVRARGRGAGVRVGQRPPRRTRRPSLGQTDEAERATCVRY